MRRLIVWLLAVCAAAGLSGCMMMNSSDLLTLPEISPEHRQLLQLINSVTASANWSTTNPVAGSNRLTTQFVDLYSDGIPEAAAFFRNQKDFKLRAVLYTKTGSASYTELCSVEMPGEQFHRVDYADLDGDGSMELLVGVRYDTAAIYGLHVYSIQNGEAAELLDTTYTDFAIYDLDGDGMNEVLTVNSDESGVNAYAELFAYEGAEMTSLGSAPVSAEVRAPSAMRTGMLNAEMPAVIAEGSFTDSSGAVKYLSDVFVFRPEQGLVNLSYAELFKQSFETQRTVPLAFSDVDFDGFLEFPISVSSPAAAVANAVSGQHVRWYGYTPAGNVEAKADTYHAADGAWFFLLPPSWRDRAYVRDVATSDYQTAVFACEQDGMQHELMTLYLFDSELDMRRCDIDGLISVAQYGGVWYAARLPDADDRALSAEMYLSGADEIRQRLAFITSGGDYRRAAALK